MKLTILNQLGVSLAKNAENEENINTLLTNCDFLPPDLFNCQSGDDIIRKLVWSEIIGDKTMVLQISLTHPRRASGCNFVQLHIDSVAEEDHSMDIFREFRRIFKDKVKISAYIKPTSFGPCVNANRDNLDCDSADHYIVVQEGLTINEFDVCICYGDSIFATNLNVDFSMKYNVAVIADISDDHERIRRAVETSIPLRANKRILDEGLGSDLILIAGNGAEIRANKSILIASSSVFQKMFVSGMEESQTSRVDLTDVAETTVKAFLCYLYFGDKISPEDDINLAFELLYAAHKYDVSDLEKIMVSHFTTRNHLDFGVELAFKMYAFVRGMGTALELQARLVRILQRNFDELKLLPEYEELFLKTPQLAMELCEQFVKGAQKRKISSGNINRKRKSKKL